MKTPVPFSQLKKKTKKLDVTVKSFSINALELVTMGNFKIPKYNDLNQSA